MRHPHTKLVPTVFASLLCAISATPAFANPVAVNPPPQTSPISGLSGGTVKTPDCGFIAGNTPNHTLQITEQINSMRIRVEATGGNPTLLIVGPDADERHCAANQPEIPGLWLPGTYQVYVGDLNGEQHSYQIYFE